MAHDDNQEFAEFNAWYDRLPADQQRRVNQLAACFLLAALEACAGGSRPDPDAIAARARHLFRLLEPADVEQAAIDRIAGELLDDCDLNF